MGFKLRNDLGQTGIICYTSSVLAIILAKIIMSETKQSWIDSLKVYRDIRMVRILLLGAISGFPWVLIASSLSLWLKEEGLSRSTIGWAGLIFGVYAFNYLWAPIIDLSLIHI